MQEHTADRIEGLLAEALAAYDDGGDAAVAAFVQDHASDRTALERGLLRARQMGLLGQKTPVADFPDRLGEFQLLKRLGSGGMGVVYEAEQQSLGRRVALKVVRPELLYFEGARERFRREIEAVARLSHPAIVPVLASGDQDGVPFYAMELLHGRTLHEITAKLHDRKPADLRSADLRDAIGADGTTGSERYEGSWWQICARITHAVALGVQHAHLRGIVHRDIKPSNIMLTVEGRTVLLDFGVAHVGGRAEFTRTGHAPGSPAFMSPEQLRGDAVDERTDVYSLAATLWQLLTLQPPFPPGSDLQRILDGDLPGPRRVNRDVPPELALVVRKAMDVDRERRYADMQAFADDLLAVLQRRPIRARRLGLGLRLLRWGQRHRVAATAIACLAAALLVLPLLLAWRERAISTRLAVAVALADSSLDTTLDAIQSLLVRVGEDRLRYVPAARPAARESLREACEMYRRLLLQHPEHGRIRIGAGSALSRYADLLARDGDNDRAMAALREGIGHLGGERTDIAPAIVNARAFLEINLARLASRLDDHATMTAALAAVERDLDALQGQAVFALDRRRNAIQRLATRAAAAPKGDAAAEADYRAALVLAREQVQARPDDALDARHLVELLDNLATHIVVAPARRDEALPLLDEALALARRIPADAQLWPPQPMLVSDVLETLGNLHVDRRDLAAVPALKECLELREQAAAVQPSDLYVRSDLAAALHNLAHLNFEQGQDDLVIERLDRAIALQRQVLAEMPTFAQARDYLVNHLTLRGSSLAKLGNRAALERTAADLEAFGDYPLALRRAARLRLRCAEVLAATEPTPADAPALRSGYVAQALQDLLAAEQAGWGTGSAFGDKVYEPLRELPEFKALLQRIAARQAGGSPPSTSSARREMPR